MYTDQNGQGVFGSLVPSMKCFQSVQILSFRAHKGDPILEIRKRPSRVKIGTLTLFSDRSQAGHRRPVFENGIVANLLPNLWTIFSHSYLSGTCAFYGRKNIAQFWAWTRVDMVRTNHDKALTLWRHMPMGQLRANIFLMWLTSTYFWASEVGVLKVDYFDFFTKKLKN